MVKDFHEKDMQTWEATTIVRMLNFIVSIASLFFFFLGGGLYVYSSKYGGSCNQTIVTLVPLISWVLCIRSTYGKVPKYLGKYSDR